MYGNFTRSQKCWAHLLRKAIKLTLVDPENGGYRLFTDRLLEVYRTACRVQRDGRRSAAGREEKVRELEDGVLQLCLPVWGLGLPPLADAAADAFRLLVNEVMRLMLDKQLFTFETAGPAAQPSGASQPVAGTNNEAERTLRTPAAARDTGRGNKTAAGARCQTVLVSVLESLRVYLTTFTLAGVIAEIQRWQQAGESGFRELLGMLKLDVPAVAPLDLLLPIPDSG